jgi:hypothetical protein
MCHVDTPAESLSTSHGFQPTATDPLLKSSSELRTPIRSVLEMLTPSGRGNPIDRS